ncbi:MAG: hypothetical protein RLZ98_61 [Pseudomonadota bacterium]|jgi:dihydroorotate dehydrogenase
MIGPLTELTRPLLFALPPEQAHEAALRALACGLYPKDDTPAAPRLAVDMCGLRFPNPIGIAAGFDKEARVPHAVLAMGCGFAEIGTVTPLPQPGNPAPRLFRLMQDRAVINRLGFNSAGHDVALKNLEQSPAIGIVGVNVGANKDSADRTGDYVQGLAKFWRRASYFTANISSPNTPGLRDLQAPAALDELLRRLHAERERLVAETGLRRPIVIKISPDIADEDLEPIVRTMESHAVDAIAVSNTTLSRAGIKDIRTGSEAGGLSGRPVFHRTTVVLARVYQLTDGRIPLIGIGGIDSGETALAKIEAGATLLQLYTGLIFEGPGLIGRIKRHLADAADRAGKSTIAELTGTRSKEWAARPLEEE